MDDDFMSDAFLVDATPSEPQTYSQRRKRTQAHAFERGKNKSRKTRELEARQEGLQRSLLDDEPSNNKGLSMLLKMGYKPGGSLGSANSKKVQESDEKKKNSPLEINMRKGRSGLGILDDSSTSSSSVPSKEVLKQEAASRQDFMDRSRTEYDSRKVSKTLASARKTCEELDIRRGIKSSFMWLDPEEEEEEEEESRKAKLKADFSANEEDDSDVDDAPLTNGREIQDEQDISEREAWLALDAPTRLQKILDYLRQEYFYCIWCGTTYDNKKDIDESCPGPEEDDH